jgi:hypothetical protein
MEFPAQISTNRERLASNEDALPIRWNRKTRLRFSLKRGETHFTTLDNAVEGLTGGTPMSLQGFESQVRGRTPRFSRVPHRLP